MATTLDNHNSSAGTARGTQTQQSVSTMQYFGINSTEDNTMISNTEIASESSNSSSVIHGSDIRNSNSVGSYHLESSISNCNEGSNSCDSYTDDDEEEGASLVPEWKDDGDDSICTSICDENENVNVDVENDAKSYEYGIHRIPSTLEFSSQELQKGLIMDGEGEQQQQQSPLVSPSSLSYSQHSSNRLLRIEMAEDGGIPSIPVISIPSGHIDIDIDFDIDSERNRNAVLDPVAAPNNSTIISTAKRRNRFRRGLHIHTGTNNNNRVPESQSFSSSASPSARSRSTNIFCRSRPRFSLMFGAMLLVMLSVHDSVNNSRQYYRQEYQLLSSDRREEIEFPLVQLETITDGVTHNDHVRTNHHHQKQPPKAELPKFYFPKPDPSNANVNSNANSNANANGMIRGSSSTSAIRPNLEMGRLQQPRPIFVPDIPLPDGGFRKPLERFVFDSQQGREQQQQYQRNQRLVLDNDSSSSSSSSWTSWMVSLTLIGMLFDTGWKEYRRYRISVISSSRDE